MTPNYAFKRTAEQALRSKQTNAPQPHNAALGVQGSLAELCVGSGVGVSWEESSEQFPLADLREFFIQAPPIVPRFPYFVLVRLPLCTLTGLLLVLLAAIAYKLLEVEPDRAFGVIAIGVSLSVVFSGLMQIIAVPYGLWTLLGVERWTSPQHWLAVACGSAHFCFFLYYVYPSILAPKH